MIKLCRLSVLVFLIALTVVAAPSYGAEVVVGTGTAEWNYPLATYYHDARTQIIYLASEIGGSCRITTLSLDVTSVPGQTMNNFTIRLKHTTLSSYGTASWESTGWTTVYHANQSIGGTGWQTFTFTVPFDYNGSDNLMVDISFNNSSYSADGLCRYSTPGGNRAIYFRTDSGYGDPLTWLGTSNPMPSTTSSVPNVKLTVEPLTSVITPAFSPDGGTYDSPQCVIMSCAMADAVIHYTTNGSTPTCDSATYTSCAQVNSGVTLKAIACKDGLDPSAVKSADYTLAAATPTFSPAGGAYTSPQCVDMGCATAGAVIHYTTDGSTPTCDSPTYTTCVQVNAGMTLKAIACKDGISPSAVKSANYTIMVETPTFSPAGGAYTSPQCVTMSCATAGAVIHYTTDGSIPTCDSTTYTTCVQVNAGMTIQAIACKDGISPSAVKSANYTIMVATPIFSPGGGANVCVSMSCATSGAVIHYTTDGSIPTCDSPTYTTCVQANAGMMLKAIACKDGISPSAVKSAYYGKVVYVKPSGSNSNSGLSWDLAKKTVQAGLNAVVSGDEVWVAGDAAHPYVERISLTAGVGLYGGFAGTESSRDQRDWRANVTVLDGNKGGSVVITPYGATTTTVIDGFTIRNGSSGGIYCSNSSPAISNNTIRANTTTGYGGGIYCSYSSPAISNNLITANTATINRGGGIFCDNSSATISNNTIAANSADKGGGIYCYYSALTISNNTIAANIASSPGGGICCSSSWGATISNNTITANSANEGGAIYCWQASPTISNNTITANSAPTGGGINCLGGNPAISNNTITANSARYEGGGIYCDSSSWPAISNNIVAFNSSGAYRISGSGAVLKNNCVYNPSGYNYSGLTAGTGDISLDPRLTIGYHLLSNSPCINTGWNAATGITVYDMDGQPRINGVIDIGADEYWVNLQGAKSANNGSGICTTSAVVTAAFTDFFYIESDSRAYGIRVNKTGHALASGMRAYVTGAPSTNTDGERCIDASDAHRSDPPNDSGSVEPLGLPNRSLGGGTFGLQGGVWGWVLTGGTPPRTWQQVTGLNNIGLLVRTCGRVVEIDGASPAAWFKIDDGSGVNVKCLIPSGVTINPTWSYVGVTGISSCETAGAELHSLLRVRAQSDIVAYTSP